MQNEERRIKDEDSEDLDWMNSILHFAFCILHLNEELIDASVRRLVRGSVGIVRVGGRPDGGLRAGFGR
jgi:hypothetical protein